MASRSVYGSSAEWARWEAAAALAGLSLNGWVRVALSEQAALDEVLAREVERDQEAGRSPAGSSSLG